MQNSKKFPLPYFLFCLCILWFVFASPVRSQSPTATSSSEKKAQQILEAVREKIKASQLAPRRRAYVGALKSIADTTLILETKNGIKQAKVSSQAAILRLEKSKKKKIKFEDLAIGDFTIAMGYIEENEVLDAKRIIVKRKEKPEKKRLVLFGLIEEIDVKKELITFKEIRNQKTWQLKITTKTKMNRQLKKIKKGERLVTISLPQKGNNLLNGLRIFILPSP